MAIKVIKRSEDNPVNYTVYAIFTENRCAEINVKLGLKADQKAGLTTTIGCKDFLNDWEMKILLKAQEIATNLLTGEISVI